MRRNGLLLAMFAVVVGATVWFVGSRSPEEPVVIDSDGSRPNVVVIMTDDQTLESMRVMPHTNRLIADAGTTFSQYVVSFPNCCPSRATFLTGQYSHNNGVRDNIAPDGGYRKLKADETLPVWLQRAGYQTASVGKYLNTWGDGGDIAPPPGWDRWYSLIDPSTYKYYEFDISIDGERTHFGSEPDDYSTDVLAREAVRFIEAAAEGSRPFFLSFTPLAPHAPAPERDNGRPINLPVPIPAPRHEGSMADEVLPRPPSYDQEDTSALPEDVQRPRVDPNHESYMLGFYQGALESLQAVDEAVAAIVDALERSGELDNTVIFYTSDNGYYFGEHRLRTGKYHLYEPAVRLPFMVRGGPFTPGSIVDVATANVDIAPTILSLAGAEPRLPLDGRDLVRVAARPSDVGDRGILLENRRTAGEYQTYGIRTTKWKLLLHHTGEVELYRLDTDPHELDNLAGTAAVASVEAELTERARVLRTCSGRSCEGSDLSLGLDRGETPASVTGAPAPPPTTAGG